MRNKAINALIEMGIPANHKGFHYILDAMEIYAKDKEYVSGKTTALYERIARMNGTTASRVERGIRYSFGIAVTEGNLDSLNKYMTAAQRPTNGNLLACLYLKLKTAP